jgi:hypothetical protein
MAAVSGVVFTSRRAPWKPKPNFGPLIQPEPNIGAGYGSFFWSVL